MATSLSGSTATTDPIRPWFDALEEEGEFIGIRFGRVLPVTGEVEWMFLSHAEFDGIGGLAHLLRQRGAPIADLPKCTHPGTLSWWPFIRFLPKMLAKRRRLEWEKLKQGDAPAVASQPPPAVAFHVFDEEKTAYIRRASRYADVTVNSFLMKYLDRAVRSALVDPASAIPWMVPVNLRGQVTQPVDVSNHSSYVGIRIYAAEGVKEVQNHIYRAIDKGEHIAAWQGFAASKHTSMKTKKQLIRAHRATSQWSVGGFSNLGVWDPENEITARDCLGDWLFAPPVLRFQMIGAGCVTFQGRLTLTLQIHPELTTSPEVASEWLRSWVREIEVSPGERE
jgi:hypothetical protein